MPTWRVSYHRDSMPEHIWIEAASHKAAARGFQALINRVKAARNGLTFTEGCLKYARHITVVSITRVKVPELYNRVTFNEKGEVHCPTNLS